MSGYPSRKDAEMLLQDANSQNPGPWSDHSRVVARIAQTVAEKCGLDTDRAYVSGLLHDIGRYEGVRGLHHVYAGYELLTRLGYPDTARICLSHSFPYQDIGAYSGGDIDCTPEELGVIETFLRNATYDDYDRLVQLGDGTGTAEGVSLLDVRLLNVIRRHGVNDFTVRKVNSFFEIKQYFDGRCGMNIYDLFYDEIRNIGFR